MRLTCPNCGAQYEVPDEVIPETGRDVQCSNCGDTWFQPHRDHISDAGDEDDIPEGTAAQEDDWEEVDPPEAPEPPSPAAEDFAPPPPPEPAAQTKPSARPERREIDPSVASVLREEAEREKRARAAAQGGVEMQPDLGLDEDEGEATRARQARERMARMRGFDPDERSDDDHDDIDPKSRSSLFPDIEEINSSLGPEPAQYDGAETGHDAYPEAAPRSRGGFGRGFLLMVLAALAALGVYAFAAQLAEMLPALRDVLADYVVWVDGLRVWLDGQIAALMLWFDTVTGNAPADTGAETGTGTGTGG
ncbi:zinc-ribbon domain-containing protein [Roseovarius aquimarinus]|uniref:Zinc-ribbon domain-containing protein n=1 Tax=Roseovarius aquimarinus TaxID=1229156 RepID=A0ABW7IAB5_9RHOB